MNIGSIIHSSQPTPRFGRKMTSSELQEFQALVAQVPALGGEVAKKIQPEQCSVMTGTGDNKLINAIRMPKLALEALWDFFRISRVIKKWRNTPPTSPPPPSLFFQWVRFPNALKQPQACSSGTCAIPSATRGSMTIENNLINWRTV